MTQYVVHKLVLTAKTVIVAGLIWVAEAIAWVTEMLTWVASFFA